jgi:DNA segregation ATPase FtsK/SpoIIIE, S-DNA-T family
VDNFRSPTSLSTDLEQIVFVWQNPRRLNRMQVKLTLADEHAGARDVLISASRPVGIREIARLLPSGTGVGSSRAIISHGRVLTQRTQLGDAGLRSGCVLTVGSPADRREQPQSVLQLHVVAGPDCGGVIPLHRGEQVVGRGIESDIRIDDPDLSRRHVRLSVDLHRVLIEDLGSTNGTFLDGERLLDTPRVLGLHTTIRIGNTRLRVTPGTDPPAVTVADDAGRLLVHRPPATGRLPIPERHQVPDRPPATTRPRIQWLTAAIPMVVSALLALIVHSTQLLAFAALGPVAVLASTLTERRSWRHARRDQAAAHAEAQRLFRVTVTQALRAETESRHRTYADAASLRQAVTVPDCRLWERRVASPSFLAVRIGLADQPSETSISEKGNASSAGVLPMVPAIVSLAEQALGVAGPVRQLNGLCRWLVGQTMILHSPADVSLILLTGPQRSQDWRWLRWLPGTALTVASSAAEQGEIALALIHLARERRQRLRIGQRWSGRWTLLLIDPATMLADLPGLDEVIADGPSVGISAVCIAVDRRELPAGCPVSVHLSDDTGAIATLIGGNRPALRVTTDRVHIDWAETATRALASLRDAEHDGMAGNLASSCRLSEIAGLPEITKAAIRERWRTSTGSARVQLGRTAAGILDLDLTRDGPHLLIAGTTGSGKSELLRTLVTGLALHQPPNELSFVLIDYKGGAAFAECAELPHVTGLVTDLDPHLTRRVLVSLNAELRRRESTFLQAGVADIDGYRHCGHRTPRPPSRLVLVIDEFASLAEELPEFLTGLLGIAQRGRSLGVHLVLATQRPAGVLSADIKANIGLRIALRVTDAADSVDVLGTDAASRITRETPGRALARLADGQILEFQTALVTMPASDGDPITVTELDEWNRPISILPNDDRPTELAVLNRTIRSAAEGMAAPDRPWQEPLPPILGPTVQPGSSTVVFGCGDEPSKQRRSAVAVDLADGDSIGFIGGPRSGRTTAVRTLIGTAVAQLTADQLHLYVLDCVGAGLRTLRQLPHCGAVLEATEPPTVNRLITGLAAERQRRQHWLAELGVASFAEAHRAGHRLPAILVALDGWDNFSNLSDDLDAGRTADMFVRLLREGPTAGITILVTGDRSVLGARIGPALKRKFLLPMTERGDYALAGIGPSAVPLKPPPGRAVSANDGIEMQLALLTDDDSTGAQWRALHARALVSPPVAHPPSIRIRPLPTSVSLTGLIATRLRSPENGRGPDAQSGADPYCTLGVGGDDATLVECALFDAATRFLVAGPDGSGRSTAAILVARQAYQRGVRLTVAAVARSPLTQWAAENHLPVIAPTDSLERIEAELLLVDDADRFTDTPAGDVLHDFIARADGAVLVTARTSDLLGGFRGIGVAMRRHRTGLLLQPSPMDGEVLGVRSAHLLASAIPGRGVLVNAPTKGGMVDCQPIQVAI